MIHRDISLANILVTGGGQPILIDFDLATMAAENRQGFAHHRDLVGTLPYLAPEQTGRTGRSVDHRADLYAIGSVLYELVAGHPPFGDGDPFKLIHDLLVRIPQPLSELDPAVPPAFSDIVARLLEKEPDRRYQSADGLARDLASVCREPASRFPLGRWDFPLRLSAPSRLVGREGEIAALRAAFDDAVGGAGRTLLVAGVPGVGKSALVNELRPLVATRGGWYVAGKADQFRSDTATGVVIQAVRGIGRLLLADPDPEVELTRERLTVALGPNAALIAEALPEFALLLPTAAGPVAGADPVGAENRLRQALLDLLRAVVSPARPVVMFLDDLQWADPATLNLLERPGHRREPAGAAARRGVPGGRGRSRTSAGRGDERVGSARRDRTAHAAGRPASGRRRPAAGRDAADGRRQGRGAGRCDRRVDRRQPVRHGRAGEQPAT